MTHYYKHQLVQFKPKDSEIEYWAIKKVWYGDDNKPYKVERPDDIGQPIHNEAIMAERIYANEHNFLDNP